MKSYLPDKLKNLIGYYNRINLICRPTPLYPMTNLSRKLAGPKIMVKRDDLTGLAFGGNKSRKLEFIVAEALSKGADTLITWGSLQSNWCLQLAAAGRKVGLRPILVLFKTYDLPFFYDGNVLLEHLLGVEIQVRETSAKGKSPNQEEAFMVLSEVAEAERKKGFMPYLVSVG
ncbi:MAG: pyridoxal-phosphate dependent enzyme, partial [Candidatus Saccharicenans sp.]